MWIPRRRTVALVPVLGLALLAGCSSGAAAPASGTDTASPTARSAPSSTSPVPPLSYGPEVPGMTALAYRARIDYATPGQFQVRVTNTGSEPFTVSGVALDSPGFQPLPPTPKDSVFHPGAVIDLRTTYGPVICTPGLAVEPANARLDVLRPDGTREQLRVPMPSDNDTVAAVHTEGCRARAIAAAVTVALVGLRVEQQNGAPTVTGTLRLQRADSEASIAVADVLGSVVLQVRAAPGTDLPVELAADAADLTVPIQIRQATCDPHYLAEVKTPFQFPLWLTFDGGEQQYSEIPVTTAQRDFLQGYLGDVCR